METITFANAFKALAATDVQSPSAASTYIPLCDSTGAVTGKVKISDLSTVIERSLSVLSSSGVDFNTITTPGNYAVSNASSAGNMSNIPVSNAGGVLYVRPFINSDSCVQMYITNQTTPKFFFRYIRVTSGTTSISDWKEIDLVAST